MDGVGKNIQVAVYDGDTLELKRVFPFRADTGQGECSGIAVDPDAGIVYMCSWIDDPSSRFLYLYDLDSGDFKGKLEMQPAPKWIQGTAEAVPERAFHDVIKQGEIEGLCFDEKNHQFLLLYNRGAKIVLGMPRGFYEGYTEEIHEVYVYDYR